MTILFMLFNLFFVFFSRKENEEYLKKIYNQQKIIRSYNLEGKRTQSYLFLWMQLITGFEHNFEWSFEQKNRYESIIC